MAKKTLCSKCSSYKRHVVWMIDRNFFCQTCGEEELASLDDVTRHQFYRLSEREADFEGGHRRKNMVAQVRATA